MKIELSNDELIMLSNSVLKSIETINKAHNELRAYGLIMPNVEAELIRYQALNSKLCDHMKED